MICEWYEQTRYCREVADSGVQVWAENLAITLAVALALAIIVAVITAGVYLGNILEDHHWCRRCEEVSRLRDAVEPEPLTPAEYAEATS